MKQYGKVGGIDSFFFQIRKRLKCFLIFLLMPIITSCTSVYLPNSQNLPTFTRAKELQGTGQSQIFIPPFAYSVQAQSAYSLTNHLYLMANYAHALTVTHGKAQLGELGMGYYTNRDANYFGVSLGYGISSASDITTNLFLIFGNSDPNSVTPFNATNIKSNYRSLFLQPSYEIRKRRFSFVFSMKVSRIDFKNTYYLNDFSPLKSSSLSYHFEPATTFKIKLGDSPFSFIGQIGIHLTNYDDLSFVRNFGRIAVGLQWNLKPKKASTIK